MEKPFNKGGRPKLPPSQSRHYLVSVRLNTQEYIRLQSISRRSGQPFGWVFRELLASGTVLERFTVEHLQFVRSLRAAANNLNQLAKHANALNHYGSASEIERTLDEVELTLKGIRYDRKNR